MKQSVFIVDDNHINLKLICDVLSYEGFTVYSAEDAETALSVIIDRQPGVILMDIQLPRMDGLTLTRILKSKPETSHIPIIAVTSFAMAGDEEKAMSAGCDGYLTKPIDTHTLPVLVRQFLESSTSNKNSQS